MEFVDYTPRQPVLAKTNPERTTYKPALLSHRTQAGSDALGELFSKSNHSPGIWPHAEALFATSVRDCDTAANGWVARWGLDIRSEELLHHSGREPTPLPPLCMHH